MAAFASWPEKLPLIGTTHARRKGRPLGSCSNLAAPTPPWLPPRVSCSSHKPLMAPAGVFPGPSRSRPAPHLPPQSSREPVFARAPFPPYPNH